MFLFSFIFFVSMSQTISVMNRSCTCYFYTHQTSGACADVCRCDRTHQMEDTEVMLLPTLRLTRLTSRSRTLIDNIMSNVITEGALSGNIINTISDHLGEFIILQYYCITSNKMRNFPKKP